MIENIAKSIVQIVYRIARAFFIYDYIFDSHYLWIHSYIHYSEEMSEISPSAEQICFDSPIQFEKANAMANAQFASVHSVAL